MVHRLQQNSIEDTSSGDTDWVVGSVPKVDNFKGNSKIVELSIGIMFHSIEEIKAFYQKYANVMGFGWKIRNSKKGDDGELNYLMLAYTREESCVKSSSNIENTAYTSCTMPEEDYCKQGIRRFMSIMSLILDHSHDIIPTKSGMYKVN